MLYVLTILLSISATVFAQNSRNLSVCEDPYRYLCGAPENIPNSKGANTNTAAIVSSDLKQKVYSQRILAAITGPSSENKKFRELALKASGYQDDPICTNPLDKGRNCNEQITDNVFALMMSHLTESSMAAPQLGGMEDVDTLNKNPFFLKTRNDLEKDLFAKLIQKNKVDAVKDYVPKIKAALIRVLNKQTMDPKAKANLIDRLSKIDASVTGCARGKDSKKSLDAALVGNGSLVGNDIEICQGFLINLHSTLSLIPIIAHELAHSLDPCLTGYAPERTSVKYPTHDIDAAEAAYPLPNLLQCLRNPSSIGAYRNELGITQFWRMIAGQKNIFCKRNDEITESVADWFAAEIMGEFLEKESKRPGALDSVQLARQFVEKLCTAGNPLGGEEHPSDERRFNQLLFQQPTIRRLMKCQGYNPREGYCNGTDAEPKTPSLKEATSSTPKGVQK